MPRPIKNPRYASPLHQSVVEQLEELRTARGTSLSELMRKAGGFSTTTWGKWSHGGSMGLDTLEAVARALGASVAVQISEHGADSAPSHTGGGLVHSESRQVAALLEELDEQGRRDVLSFAQSYKRSFRAAGEERGAARTKR